jgi:hypothetical protein
MLRPTGDYSEIEARVLDTCLIIHAEHGGGNNSTFTTHTVSSTGTDTYSAIAAAVGSLKGPRHGGASTSVIYMMNDLKDSVTDITDYDEVESLLFSKAGEEGMKSLAELYEGEIIPSRAFVDGGIHEAIIEYENNIFFDILAEDLARRDMEDAAIDQNNYEELVNRIEAYLDEFEAHGTDRILVETDDT